MTRATQVMWAVVGCAVVLMGSRAVAQDWPQWRGPNRDAKASGFQAPATWPQQLAKAWQVTVGDGVASPALVGDRLYVFARQDGHEVARCLDADTGAELWQDKYEAEGATGPASSFSGPRSTPTVSNGKVVTLGVRGVLSCLDAATGDVAWRKDDFQGAWPRFFASSSPIVTDGLCIAQLGGQDNGGIVAYDLDTGDERWRWAGDSPAYASPVLLTVGGRKTVLSPTDKSLVAVDVTDGALVWEIPYEQGRYNSATPIVDGQTVILAGPGTGITAVAINQAGDGLTEERLWNNTDNSVQFNTPVVKNGLLFGLSNSDRLFCINVQSQQTAWAAPIASPTDDQQAPAATAGTESAERRIAEGRPDRGEAGERPSRRGRGRGGRGGRGRGGYGSIVDAGDALVALTPAAELVVFQPTDQSYQELARYKVAESPTYAYPVVADRGIYVKDQDSVTLWKIE